MRKRIMLSLLVAFGMYGCIIQETNAQAISLAGEWTVRLDADSTTTKIRLPGSLQEQGVGNDIDIHTPWTGGIVDDAWYKAPEYEKYRQKGNIKVPFWLNPEKHYVGVAWYTKEVVIPAGWKGKTLCLSLERTHWETTLYVDDVEVGKQESLSTPHRYLLSPLTPGRHTLTLKIDNRIHIPVGINAHSVSDHTQSNWNGCIGQLSLSAKPDLYIEDIQVYPDIPNRKVNVTVRLKGTSPSGKANLSLQLGSITNYELRITPGDDLSIANYELRMAEGELLLWSEYTPNLYRLKTTLTFPGGKDEVSTSFGFREFKRDHTRFAVNGQPVFLRGTLECCIFPLTGYPSMERSYWAKIYRACKDFGLNHVRFHSWCPPEVAFDVADSMGVYLQVECAAWTTVGDGGEIDRWIREESDRILAAYGNHPSFCMLTYGNEPGGANRSRFLSELVDYWKKKDNRRVYASAAGWAHAENADYWNMPEPRIQGWGEGLQSIINAQPPRTDYDWREKIPKGMPAVSHEIGQWCVYPDFNEISRYTGVLKAKNLEIF
ncbi:MAG: beta-galactosidase, partial [Tannerellaceae bacterium]|nr:beta-galactosidase [Tannerellaceae bacterium]